MIQKSLLPQALRCRLDRHMPDLSKVLWDGWYYIGQCRHCGLDIRLRKRGRKRGRSQDRWHRDWLTGNVGLA